MKFDAEKYSSMREILREIEARGAGWGREIAAVLVGKNRGFDVIAEPRRRLDDCENTKIDEELRDAVENPVIPITSMTNEELLEYLDKLSIRQLASLVFYLVRRLRDFRGF